MVDVIDRRLSLVAAYDDLVRNTSVLTQGIEAEFYKFVTNQDSAILALQSVRGTLECYSKLKDELG